MIFMKIEVLKMLLPCGLQNCCVFQVNIVSTLQAFIFEVYNNNIKRKKKEKKKNQDAIVN